MVVEAALADGHRPHRAIEQIEDRVDAVARLVRVQPNRGMDVREPTREVQCLEGGGAIATDGDQLADADLAGLGDERLRFVRRDVTVRVDPGHALIRGNIGAPLTTGTPPG